ncbi:hypothetical protein ES705_17586 [subsurface metagenome]|jgi:hypothetical protein
MNIVSYSEAARIANVSRQAVHVLKKAHLAMIRHYPFFCQDPKTKETGVDIDNPDWRLYLTKNRYNPCKKDRQRGSQKIIVQQPDDKTIKIFIDFLRIVEQAVLQVMDPSRGELKKIKSLCMKIYQEKS